MKSILYKFLNVLLNNKTFFSGIAMTMVILYHLFGMDSSQKIWTIFAFGYTGVDIFLLLSGYSLCYSYAKNKKKVGNFYKRRFFRIIPLFWFMSITVSVLYNIFKHDFSIGFLFCNMTSLNYYGLGGCFIEWYLSALIIFYIIFPFLYRLTDILQGWILILIAFTIFFICAISDIDWFYLCAIGRVPIFIFGIILYRVFNKGLDERNISKVLLVFAMACLFSLPLFLYQMIHTYAVIYTCVPILLFCISRLFQNNSKYNKIICWIGKYTLEIYVANTIVCNYMKLSETLVNPAIDYTLLHIVLVPVTIQISNMINKMISRVYLQ